MSTKIELEFPGFLGNTAVHERNLLERWVIHRGPEAKGKPALTLTFSAKASNIAQIWNYKLPKHS
jgi:hypothetical protein